MSEKNGKPKDWGRIVVATRLEKMVENQFVVSWSHLITKGLRRDAGRPDGFILVKDRVAHMAANDAVRAFLATDYDTLCFIDSDWDGGPSFLEELRNVPEGWEYDVFQAFYTRRGWPPEAIWFKYTELGDLMQCLVWKDDHTEEVALVGLHCTLIRREVLEAVRASRPDVPLEDFTWFYYPKDGVMSEDAAFSRDIHALGFRMGATTAVKAGHIGRVTTGWDTYQEYLQLSGAVDVWQEYFDLVELIADFTGETTDTVIARAMKGWQHTKAAWEELRPQSPEEVRRFYGNAENGYLYDLLAWNVSPLYRRIIAPLREVVDKKVLVIGAGLGNEVAALHERNHVAVFELPGILWDFLMHRFLDGSKADPAFSSVQDLVASHPERGEFDLVVAIDTLEHVHPDEFEETMDALKSMLCPGGAFYLHNTWDKQEKAPQHFDNGAAFEDWCQRNGFERTGEYTWSQVAVFMEVIR